MGRVSFVRRGLRALLGVCIFLGANPARAQTAPSPSVTLADIVTHSIARDGYRTNNLLNFSDCESDDVITFSLLLSERQSNTLEVWAGTQCDDLTARTTVGATQCWLVASLMPTSDTELVPVHLRDILAGRTVFASTTGSSQTLPQPGTVITGTDANACFDPSGIPVANQITLYFMLVDGSKAISGTAATWTAKYKLIGPPPPDQVTATPAARSLDIHFEYANFQTSDITINGFQFYCDPAPGTTSDAGASTACDELAQTQTLTPGELAHSNALCGDANLSATSGTTYGLEIGVPYHVAVAAVDTFQNVGPLSNLACGIPESDSTSRACGCAVPGPSPRGALPVLGFMLALVGLSRRRTRRRA
jgi:hypothetical protein